MKSKRIGIVLAVVPAYSETFFRSKIVGLQEYGFEVILFVNQSNSDFDLCSVKSAPKIYRNPFLQVISVLAVYLALVPFFNSVLRFWRLERTRGNSVIQCLKSIYINASILSSSVDWLHFGFATMALERENLAKAINAKMGVSFRGYDITIYPLKHPNCYDLLWERIDKVHSISRYLLEQAYSLGLKRNTVYEIITPAVNLDTLPKAMVITKFNEPYHLITVARLHWVKGLDISIKAIKLLREMGIACHYSIIGEGNQKEYERYAYLAHDLGIGDCVHFEGKLNHDETLRKMSVADLYLQPSLNEGFCNAVLEAQGLGKICIASRVGGLTENIVDGETGFLVTPNNPDELAFAIRNILNLSPEVIRAISEKAIERVEKKFSVLNQQERFVAFYNFTE